jgi:hypothetical protein
MDQEDKWAEEAVAKHLRRSGIRRLYCYPNTRDKGRLELEVVLRGHVFFRIRLWAIRPMMDV